MPRAAPGVIARLAMRRISKGHQYILADKIIRQEEEYSRPKRRGIRYYLDEQKRYYFAQHSSGLGVKLGRLGEVESLVGDCRPPPPGNPRRLTILSSYKDKSGGRFMNPVQTGRGFYVFTPVWERKGAVYLPIRKHSTLNITKSHRYLKRLNKTENFKNTYSYSSCMDRCSVLKFGIFHYHLYGVWLVEPPSIAITNVLGT
jgi:hypothetical protein